MTGWVRSSHCAAGDCIEAALIGSAVALRHANATFNDTPYEFRFGMTRAEWDAFTAGIRDGDFDSLGDTP